MQHFFISDGDLKRLRKILSSLEANDTVLPVATIDYCVKTDFSNGYSATTVSYRSTEYWPASTRYPSEPMRSTITIIEDPDGTVTVPRREDY